MLNFNKITSNFYIFSNFLDYYKRIRTNSYFDNSYFEYESKGDKDKILSIKWYLNIVRPYLRDIIHDHKTQGEWKVHLRNTIISYKTQEECKT